MYQVTFAVLFRATVNVWAVPCMVEGSLAGVSEVIVKGMLVTIMSLAAKASIPDV